MASLVLALAGCGPDLSVEEKYKHLREVADKGADAHFALINENKETTREVCDQHYNVFVPDGAPAENDGVGSSLEWRQLSKDYFGDSCVKGEPRVIQTRSTAQHDVRTDFVSARKPCRSLIKHTRGAGDLPLWT